MTKVLATVLVGERRIEMDEFALRIGADGTLLEVEACGLCGSDVETVAHHDSTVFAEPGTFDITRDGAKVMWFGFGPHFYNGVRRAWIETEAAIRQLLAAFPNRPVSATDDPSWRDSLMIRGLERFPVRAA